MTKTTLDEFTQNNPHLSNDVEFLQNTIINLRSEITNLRKIATINGITINSEIDRKLNESRYLLKAVSDDFDAIINYMCIKEIIKDNPILQDQFDEFFICLSLIISENDYNKKLKITRLELYDKARKKHKE